MSDKHDDQTPEEISPLPQGFVLSPEQSAARSKRNIAIALSLVAFVALVFFATYVRLTGNIETRIQDGAAPPSSTQADPAT